MGTSRRGHKKSKPKNKGGIPDSPLAPNQFRQRVAGAKSVKGAKSNGRKVELKSNSLNGNGSQPKPSKPDDIDKHESIIANDKKRGDASGLLKGDDPTTLAQDLKLIESAIAKGWNVRRKDMIRQRMEDIAAKTSAEVFTKMGMVESETAADELAIKAASILEKMDTADVKRMEAIKNIIDGKNGGPSTQVNVNVNTNASDDHQRSALAELLARYGADRRDRKDESVIQSSSVEATTDIQGNDDRQEPSDTA